MYKKYLEKTSISMARMCSKHGKLRTGDSISTKNLLDTDSNIEISKKSSNLKKPLHGILVLLVLAAGLTIILYGRRIIDMKKTFKNLDEEVRNLEMEIKNLKNNQETGGKEVISLTLCLKQSDDNAIMNVTRNNGGTRQIIEDWSLVKKNGNIGYEDGVVHISATGIYHVYAQMYFSHNTSTIKSDNFGFDIQRKLSFKTKAQTIALASVSSESCQPGCTKHTSKLVQLDVGDEIYISKSPAAIKFKMSCEASFFGIIQIESA